MLSLTKSGLTLHYASTLLVRTLDGGHTRLSLVCLFLVQSEAPGFLGAELATVAMVASSVPSIVGNGIAKCAWGADYAPISQKSTCTATPWQILDFSAVRQSCGPEAYHYERCCHVMIGMFAQILTYREESKAGPLPQVRI